jgi:hypothetical protein
MTIWRTRIACWIPKTTHTHTQIWNLVLLLCNNGWTNAPQYYVRCIVCLVCIRSGVKKKSHYVLIPSVPVSTKTQHSDVTSSDSQSSVHNNRMTYSSHGNCEQLMISNITRGPPCVRLRMFGVLHIAVKYTIALVTRGHCRTRADTGRRQAVARTLDSRCLTIERPNTIMPVLFSFVNALQSVPETMCQCRRKTIWTFQIVSRCINSPIFIKRQPQLAAHESLWTEIPYYSEFWFTAIPIHSHKLLSTVAPYRGFAILFQERSIKCCL